MASQLKVLLLAHPATAVLVNERLVSASADIADKPPTTLPSCDEIARVATRSQYAGVLFSAFTRSLTTNFLAAFPKNAYRHIFSPVFCAT